MNLLDYPMDAPVCPLLLAGCTVWNRQYLNASNIIHCYNYLQLLDDTVYYLFSDGYTTDEIIYRWQTSNKSGVEIYDDVTLSQFDIVSIWTANNTYSDALGKYFIIFVVSSNKMSRKSYNAKHYFHLYYRDTVRPWSLLSSKAAHRLLHAPGLLAFYQSCGSYADCKYLLFHGPFYQYQFHERVFKLLNFCQVFWSSVWHFLDLSAVHSDRLPFMGLVLDKPRCSSCKSSFRWVLL